MKLRTIIIISFYFLLAGIAPAAHDDCTGLDPAFPEDVARFKQQRCACYHFSGEEPYDDERKHFLSAKIRQTCTGLKELRGNLRRKYVDQPSILIVLEVDESIVN